MPEQITTVDDCLVFFETPNLPTDTKELRFVYGLGRQLAAEVRALREKLAITESALRSSKREHRKTTGLWITERQKTVRLRTVLKRVEFVEVAGFPGRGCAWCGEYPTHTKKCQRQTALEGP